MEAYLKVRGGKACKKMRKTADGGNVIDLARGEMAMAEEAKKVALSVLRDALKKKDRLLMEEGPHDPMPLDTAASMGPQHGAMMRYAIVTPSEVQRLIDTMEKICFKKDTNSEHNDVYAYVYPNDKKYTVYLCELFWSSLAYLKQDSRPGTLIHEVSHFLGSEDIDYAERNIKVVMGGNFYQVGQPGNAALASPETLCDHYALLKGNANSIEYEFEILLNHSKAWDDRKSYFPCCGESSRHSVCLKSVSDEFAFFLGD